ncbi:alpha/beta fold hydrolase [Antrihabitans cavernicola]|uniref:alpha/beta fold hydrolase n=1 Tax=Antrihabitans cavernicola TaxID=2495913 RepID=UPI001F33EB69|nr:alpha/beta hydrolase [Spelaeibacter cavernicola]
MKSQKNVLLAPVGQRDDALLRPISVEPEVIPVVTEDGASLRVHAYGPKGADPIVLAHGWTCNIEYWTPQINALADRYRVIAYDQRGHGESTFGSRKASADVLADDLAAVLSATVRRGKRALLVGHSMGGMSIMAWAGKNPDQVDRLAAGVVLMNTASDSLLAQTTVIPMPGRMRYVRSAVGRAVLGAPIPLPHGRVITRGFKYGVLSPGATRAEVEFCQQIVVSCSGRARSRWGMALADLDITAALENLNVPTTVIAGELDRLTPQSHSRRLAEALDSHDLLDKFVVLPGVGHMGNVEASLQVNDEIVRMRSLAKRRRPRRRLSVVAG